MNYNEETIKEMEGSGIESNINRAKQLVEITKSTIGITHK